ncbi:MAG TPA: YgjV family protein [Gammaproteobacteria bacterium]|nr:YgjV family protein [Gammaproteobacteria bacterium]
MTGFPFDADPRLIAAQLVSLIALALCLVAVANKRDDRLFSILLLANIAFTAQFALFGSWVSAGITLLIILRLILVRRYRGNVLVMASMLLATLGVAWLTWQRPLDVTALAAGLLGTYGMFMMRGVAMRVMLGGAAMCWVLNNLLIGSIGGTLAESLVLATNMVTIARLVRDRRRSATV